MIEWRTDWENAPRETNFIVLFNLGDEQVVTTAKFYWYTEDGFEDFRPVAYYALQDVVRDCPLDENGPPGLSDMKWAALK